MIYAYTSEEILDFKTILVCWVSTIAVHKQCPYLTTDSETKVVLYYDFLRSATYVLFNVT